MHESLLQSQGMCKNTRNIPQCAVRIRLAADTSLGQKHEEKKGVLSHRQLRTHERAHGRNADHRDRAN